MSRTTRKPLRYLRYTRSTFVNRQVHRALVRAVAAGFFTLPRPRAEWKARKTAEWNAYVGAWHAWNDAGRTGIEPMAPWNPSRSLRYPIDHPALNAFILKETQEAERFWDRMMRDGGSHRVDRPDYDHVTSKQLRRKAKVGCRVMVKNPNTWDDNSWDRLMGDAQTFPDLW